jgi:L-lactate utilization protein LutB
MDTKGYRNIRARLETQRKLKIIAALRHESMLDTLERLVQQEYERVLREGGKRHVADQEDQA